MRKTIFLSAAIMLAGLVSAQDNKPVVILQTTGKVGLISKGKTKASPVVSGAVANPSGALKLGKGASALVYCGGQYKTIKDTEKAELPSVCASASKAKMTEVDMELGGYIMAAVDMVAVAKANGDGWVRGVIDRNKGGDGWGTGVIDRNKGGDGWGTGVIDRNKGGDGWGTGVIDRNKGGDGWGGKGNSIRLVMPFGVVSKGLICFNWSRPENKDPYRLEILDDKGTLVHAQSVQDTFVCMDLSGINLLPEKIYSWRIKVGGTKNLNSNELKFSIGDVKEREEALLSAGSTTQAGNTELAALAKAISLEKREWYYDAHMVYADLQKTNPSNLVKMMHAAFWRRHGYTLLSQKATVGN